MDKTSNNTIEDDGILIKILDAITKYNELKRKYRFIFLGVIIFLEFGRYVCQEMPAALQVPLMEVTFKLFLAL